MKVRKISVFFAVFLAILVSASGSPISVDPENASASPGESVYFSLEFTDIEGNFSVGVEGPGEISVNPKNFSLRERENVSVNIWFRPYNEIEEGRYELFVRVFKDGRLLRTMYPSIRVSNEHSVVLTSFEGPECRDRQLSLLIENEGMFSEKINVFFAGEELAESSIDPGNEINLTLKTEKSGLLEVIAEESYAYDSIRVQNVECGGDEVLASLKERSATLKVSLGIILLLLTGLVIYRI